MKKKLWQNLRTNMQNTFKDFWESLQQSTTVKKKYDEYIQARDDNPDTRRLWRVYKQAERELRDFYKENGY